MSKEQSSNYVRTVQEGKKGANISTRRTNFSVDCAIDIRHSMQYQTHVYKEYIPSVLSRIISNRNPRKRWFLHHHYYGTRVQYWAQYWVTS